MVQSAFCWGNFNERNHLEYISVDGKVILKWILKLGLYCVDRITVIHAAGSASCCEEGEDILVDLKCREIFTGC